MGPMRRSKNDRKTIQQTLGSVFGKGQQKRGRLNPYEKKRRVAPITKARVEGIVRGQALLQETLKDRWSPPDSMEKEGLMQSFGDNIEETQYHDKRFRL